MIEIKFSEMDSAILYSIPQPGVDLAGVIRYYCFINRDAPPPFAVLASCLSNSAAVGILIASADGRFTISRGWYEYIHRFDSQTSNEIESLIAFDELFTPQTWRAVAEHDVRLSENNYNAAVALIRR